MATSKVDNRKGYTPSSSAERKAAGTRSQLEAREKAGTITVGDKGILEELREEARKRKSAAEKAASKVINIVKGIGSGIIKSVKKRTGSETMYEKKERERKERRGPTPE
jgi:hypothetical protein